MVFRLKDYPERNVGMHFDSREEAEAFYLYLNKHSRRWCSGCRYIDSMIYSTIGGGTVVFFNKGTHGSLNLANNINHERPGTYTILRYSDFEWYDESDEHFWKEWEDDISSVTKLLNIE